MQRLVFCVRHAFSMGDSCKYLVIKCNHLQVLAWDFGFAGYNPAENSLKLCSASVMLSVLTSCCAFFAHYGCEIHSLPLVSVCF